MVMTDLLDLFHQLVRFETELWNAADARLRAEFDLPLTRLEPMQIIARHPSCRSAVHVCAGAAGGSASG
jgi:hypothetical protein